MTMVHGGLGIFLMCFCHLSCNFDLCRFGVSGYPTIKFFPKTNKDGEDYEGGRDIDSFVTFINEKCGTSRDAKGQLTSTVSI